MILSLPFVAYPATITCQPFHAPWYHFQVGIFAGLIGLAAVIMSFKEQASWKWKWAWLAGIFLFTAAELRMIVWNESDAHREREFAACETRKSFSQIEKDNQEKFNKTIAEVGEVYARTKEAANAATKAANMAHEGIASLTGGDSWGSVIMIPFGDDPDRRFFMVSNSSKKYTLRGVRLAILNKSNYAMQQCDVGDIAPNTGYNAPFTPSCIVTIDPSIENHFLIIIGALNGGTYEDIVIKGTSQTYEVYKALPDGKRKILKFSHPPISKNP